jgi:hypothetical protein
MIRSSALYIAITVALVLALFCSALLAFAYYYRLNYESALRRDTLALNLSSAVNILLADEYNVKPNWTNLDLYGEGDDSVRYRTILWGIYRIGITQAFRQQDTLHRVFSAGIRSDTAERYALYVADEDRPVSLSGTTRISGNVYLPKAGIRTAYMENAAYTGPEAMILKGAKRSSGKDLPALKSNTMLHLEQYFQQRGEGINPAEPADTSFHSFRLPTRYLSLGMKPIVLKDTKLRGNIIIQSDTTLILDSTLELNQAIVVAKSIEVKNGFRCTCQLFATDSVHLGDRIKLLYPSAVGIIGSADKNSPAPKIYVGRGSTVSGAIFISRHSNSTTPSIMQVQSGSSFNGLIYTPDFFEYAGKITINGQLLTRRLLYRSKVTLYENYLYNMSIDQRGVPPYYLSGALLDQTPVKFKVLQWLEKE